MQQKQEIKLKKFKVADLFGFDSDLEVEGFASPTEFVPEIDKSYKFDKETTEAIVAGLTHNLRVLIQGYHGTGKSTHIEQVAARLNWPCFRINLDGHISRLDLIGKDGIVVKSGKQVTEFKEGILPWSMSHPMILVFDEYDAGRPEVMFVIQRLMEQDGVLSLPDQNRVIKPHPKFRLMGTSNTVGLGDSTGLYQGTHLLNQAQMDRWNVVSHLNYLPEEKEVDIITGKITGMHNQKELVERMVRVAGLTRVGFMASDISTVMSPRTVINWARNYLIFGSVYKSFNLSFLNRCDTDDRETIEEYYVKVFGEDFS